MDHIIKTQADLDSLDPKTTTGTIYIEGGTEINPIVLKVNFEEAHVITRGTAQIIMRGSSQVRQMWGSSQVRQMWGSSQVLEMRGSSQVRQMRESSQVLEMRGSSQVRQMWESSQVLEMRESSQVLEMRESSQVRQMRGEAMVSCYGLQKITCSGYNVVRTRAASKKDLIVILNDSSHLIVIPDPETTFDDYQKRYPVVVNGNFATLYKAVHKNEDGTYFSHHSSVFKYEIGKIFTEKCNPSLEESCAAGLHVSHLSWAKSFGRGWSDLAIIECKVPVDKILVAKDCDGKVRTSQLEVIRELDKSEYDHI